MSFREKMHWVSLVAIIAAFGWYFAVLPWGAIRSAPLDGLAISGTLMIALIILVILLMSVGAGLLALRHRDEVSIREDERDRAIHWRGTHTAYYLMIVGAWSLIGLAFAGVGVAVLVNGLLAVVVLAEVLRIGTQIWLYRRGV